MTVNLSSKKIMLIGGSCLLIGLLLLSQHGPITSQLEAWKVLPEPERVTELYFNNVSSLPNTYTPGSQQAISFKIRNVEFKTVEYRYTIDQISEDTNQATRLLTGTVKLDHEESRTISPKFTLIDLEQSVIRISLSPSNNVIQYKVNKV